MAKKAEEKEIEESKRFTREELSKELPVVLTDSELLDYSRELARNQCEKTEKEDKKKEVVAEYTAELKKFEADIAVLSRKITTGTEQRDVDCAWEYDWLEGSKKLIRLDTEEVVREATIQGGERQQHFDVEMKAQQVKDASELKAPIGELVGDEVKDELGGD